MKLYLRLPRLESAEVLAIFLNQLDESAESVDGVYVPDSQALARDPIATIAFAAAHTDALSFTLAVTNFVTRHWTVVRNAAQTLVELTGHRFRIAVGVGDSAVGLVGLKPSNHSTFSDTLRAFASREDWVDNRPPLLLASNRPRLLELAGAVADGVIIQAGRDPTVIRKLINSVHSGAVSSKRDPKSLEVACSLYVSDADLSPQERRIQLTLKYLAASRRDPRTLELMGLPSHELEREQYVDFGHMTGLESKFDISGRVLDDFAEKYVVPSDPEHGAQVLRSLERVGVSEVCLMSLAPDSEPLAMLGIIRALKRQLASAKEGSYCGR